MPPRALLAALASALVALAALGVASCSSVNNQRIGINGPPFDETTFGPLADYMVSRCGSLDCHGSTSRNLRIYGCDGLRLDPDASTSCVAKDPGGTRTTAEEYQATYRSLVGLEPQVMSTVWAGCAGAMAQGDAGVGAYPAPPQCHPELLTFVQKARGLEKHKGGQLICVNPPCPVGIPNPVPYPSPTSTVHADLQDVCIVTWLEGATDVTACGTAAYTYGFPPQDASTE